jgi:hypothetical protein
MNPHIRSAISNLAVAFVILVIGIAAATGVYMKYSTSTTVTISQIPVATTDQQNFTVTITTTVYTVWPSTSSSAITVTPYPAPVIPKNSSIADVTGDWNASSLQLVLKINASEIISGQGVDIEYYFANPTSQNITLNSIWKYAMPYETPPCGGLVIPALYLGVYTKANISQATPLNLWQPNMGTACPSGGRAFSYTFLPNSTQLSNSPTDTWMPIYGYLIASHNCPYYNGTTIYNTEANCWITQPFPSGNYTIAVGDEWNDLALLYLTVM